MLTLQIQYKKLERKPIYFVLRDKSITLYGDLGVSDIYHTVFEKLFWDPKMLWTISICAYFLPKTALTFRLQKSCVLRLLIDRESLK